MDGCRLKRDVEELAAAVVVADVSDAESMAVIRRLVLDIEAASGQFPFVEIVADAVRDLLSVGKDGIDRLDAAALSHLGEAVEGLQKEIRKAHKEAGATCSLDAKPALASAAPQALPAGKERDADTIALIGEFLSESEEGLSRADSVLMGIERDGATPEAINGLFRVFHTIKGVAGFLELFEIQSLAHTTESLLNGCREGTFPLAGTRLDLVFDATAMMRKILTDLRTAVETSREFVTQENIADLVARLKLALDPAMDDGKGKATDRQAASSRPEDVQVPGPEPPGDENPVVHPASTPTAPIEAGTVSPTASTASQAPSAAKPDGADTKIRATIKVDLERVDRLVEMIGELVVVEAMVGGSPEIAHSGSARVRNCLSQLAKVTRDLQDEGMRMRMLPVSSVFQKMARMARDVGRRAGKQVRVVLSGEQTEMDRSMVEQISDPLVHMIRNSVDHGIEPAEARRLAGKSEEGTVRLSACHEGGSVVIEIADDGRGLNREAILKKAVAQGLLKSGDTLSDEEINSLIFAPGFSTAEKVTDISGRGVGMDVVRRNIDAMRGRITITSVPGQGTTFKITLPLTLAIIDGMLVTCGAERYILPTLSVVESMKPEASMLVTQGGTSEMLNMRGMILPLLRLDRLLGTKGGIQDPTQALVVIVEGMGRKVGLLVDEVMAQQQVVIKTMGEGIGQVMFFSGAAVLADGRVGLIVNVEEIAAETMERRHLGFAGDKTMINVVSEEGSG